MYDVTVDVSLKEPTFSNTSLVLSTDYKTSSIEVTGLVSGPDGKPKASLNLQFSTKPDTIVENTTTNA